MGNKKVGLGRYYSGMMTMKDSFIFGDCHVKAFGVVTGCCRDVDKFEAEMDSCICPENRGEVNETVATIGQHLNEDLEGGSEILRAFSKRHGGRFDWIIEGTINKYSKGMVEEDAKFDQDLQNLMSYEFGEGVRVTRSKVKAVNNVK